MLSVKVTRNICRASRNFVGLVLQQRIGKTGPQARWFSSATNDSTFRSDSSSSFAEDKEELIKRLRNELTLKTKALEQLEHFNRERAKRRRRALGFAVIFLIVVDAVFVAVWLLYGESSDTGVEEKKEGQQTRLSPAQLPLFRSLLSVGARPPAPWVGQWSNDSTTLNIFESGRVVSEERAPEFVSGFGEGVITSFSPSWIALHFDQKVQFRVDKAPFCDGDGNCSVVLNGREFKKHAHFHELNGRSK
eukprot:TRINITY_DN993_c0_g1_i3.p1 TRINITY_DN993_c0_g1~~TRINITY_DN993_c0_g1_i3.p1  ORF type:complete len:248 (-),score=33.98 TRINITY_DN993_c0_g1_i3:1554-2297(-)